MLGAINKFVSTRERQKKNI